MNTEQKIEAILFALGEPVTLHELIGLIKENEDTIKEGIEALKTSLSNRGVMLVESHHGYTLGTHPEASNMLDTIRKDELGKELSKSSLETLAIILYYNGATRSDIDFIRGVNSNFILRNLVMRGLIERTEYAQDSRKSFYVPTLDLMTHLGVSTIAELPDFASIHKMFVERNTHMVSTANSVNEVPSSEPEEVTPDTR